MRTYQFKLYHSKRNRYLHQQIDIAGCIYNHCIALHKRYYRFYGKYLDIYQLQKHLTKLKKVSKYSFWNLLGSQAIQEITERIDKGYKRFFDFVRKKSTQKVSPPGFKKVKKYKSFTLKQSGWGLDGNRIRIGKHYFGYFASRPIEGNVKTVTIKRDSCGDLFIFFACELEEQLKLPMTGKSAGFDFGLLTFLTPSNGEDILAPLFLKRSLRQLRTCQKSLSRKEKGSNHRKQAKVKVAKLHRRISNLRRNYHFQLGKQLCVEYDNLYFEDLNMKGMQSLWGRKIGDLGFSEFLKILESQATKYDKKVHYVDRYFASTKTCSRCGYKKEQLSLKERMFCCDNCSIVIPRDKNAAICIEKVGTSTFGLDIVRPVIVAGEYCLNPESHTRMYPVH